MLEAIARLGWVFAKTMPEWPHEYTVRRKATDEADYIALWEAIMRDGVVMVWRGSPGPYLYPGDGWRYWDMRPKLGAKLEWSRHINRCKVEEVERLRGLGLVADWDPAKKPVKPVLPKPQLTYTRRFTRVFSSMLGAHGYELSVSKDETLVIAVNDAAKVQVEIINPNKPGGSKRAVFTVTRQGEPPFSGKGRDALAKALGVPAYSRRR